MKTFHNALSVLILALAVMACTGNNANAAKAIPKDVQQVLNIKLMGMGDQLFDRVRPDAWILEGYKLVEETPSGYIVKLEMSGNHSRKTMICPIVVDFGATIQEVYIDFTDKRQCAMF